MLTAFAEKKEDKEKGQGKEGVAKDLLMSPLHSEYVLHTVPTCLKILLLLQALLPDLPAPMQPVSS
jgi:hypothetical protein